MSQLVVQRPTPRVVTVSTPRLSAALRLLFSFLFIAFWYWALLEQPRSVVAAAAALRRLPERGLWLCLFALVPLMITPRILGLMRAALRGQVYTFDASSREITLNGVSVAQFGEVEVVQVRTLYGRGGSSEYMLSLLLQGDRKIPLGQADDRHTVLKCADDIADELKVTVRSV